MTLNTILTQVHYPRYMSEPAVSFVSSLLRHDENDRLGSGSTSKSDIKNHRFFAGKPKRGVSLMNRAFGAEVRRGEEGVLRLSLLK